MGIVYLTIAFLPVLAGVIGWIGIGITILVYGAFFLVGLRGLEPVPS